MYNIGKTIIIRTTIILSISRYNLITQKLFQNSIKMQQNLI